MVAELELVARLILAAVLGAAIGYEKEVHKKPAGMRTHTLVCMGAALFTIVSTSFVSPGVDISRIAAGVVVGIGFLGAGTIFHNKNKVMGLTTAAELWALAAIGIAAGLGLYLLAIVTAAITLLILSPGKYFEKKAVKKK